MGSKVSYFIAIDLPLEVRDELMLIAAGVPGAYWVDEEQLHLTLRYLGEIDGLVLRNLQGALDRIDARSFVLQLEGIGFFPPRGEPEVLWVGVEKSQPLSDLRARVDALASRLGVPADRKRYTPHVTLARLHDAPDSRLARFAMEQALFKSTPFSPLTFSLYASRRNETGSEYQRIAAYVLRGGDARVAHGPEGSPAVRDVPG